MITRDLLENLRKTNKSILLLGPRQTGKTTLIRQLKPDLEINLSKESSFLEFHSDSKLFEQIVESKKYKTIFVDEIQRIPSLLNSIQYYLDNPSFKHLRFFLTGSSARKLRRGQANLLPGRVVTRQLGPVHLRELKDFNPNNLNHYISYGTLPAMLNEDKKEILKDVLKSYAGTYLSEEIQAEGLTKDLPGFARFLKSAAAHHGAHVDFTKWGSLSQIGRHACARYFKILEDTLIAYSLHPFTLNLRGRLVQHPRYYFFDNGVLNGILSNFNPSADRIGPLFENFVVSQIQAFISARNLSCELFSYRTEHGSEIDLIVKNSESGELHAIEIKSSINIGAYDFNGFKSFKSMYQKKFKSFIICMTKNSRIANGIKILSLYDYLSELK